MVQKTESIYLYIFGQKSQALILVYSFYSKAKNDYKEKNLVNVLLFEFVKMLLFIKIMYRITVTKRGHDVCKLPPM